MPRKPRSPAHLVPWIEVNSKDVECPFCNETVVASICRKRSHLRSRHPGIWTHLEKLDPSDGAIEPLVKAIRTLTLLLHALQAAQGDEQAVHAAQGDEQAVQAAQEVSGKSAEPRRMWSCLWEDFKILRNGKEARCQTCGTKVPIEKGNSKHKNMGYHKASCDAKVLKVDSFQGPKSADWKIVAQNVTRLLELKYANTLPDVKKVDTPELPEFQAFGRWSKYWQEFDEDNEEISWIPKFREPAVSSLSKLMPNERGSTDGTSLNLSAWISSHRDEYRNAIFIGMYERLYQREIGKILSRASRHPWLSAFCSEQRDFTGMKRSWICNIELLLCGWLPQNCNLWSLMDTLRRRRKTGGSNATFDRFYHLIATAISTASGFLHEFRWHQAVLARPDIPSLSFFAAHEAYQLQKLKQNALFEKQVEGVRRPPYDKPDPELVRDVLSSSYFAAYDCRYFELCADDWGVSVPDHATLPREVIDECHISSQGVHFARRWPFKENTAPSEQRNGQPWWRVDFPSTDPEVHNWFRRYAVHILTIGLTQLQRFHFPSARFRTVKIDFTPLGAEPPTMSTEHTKNLQHLTQFISSVEYIATLDLLLEGTEQLSQIVSYLASQRFPNLLSRVQESLVLRLACFERMGSNEPLTTLLDTERWPRNIHVTLVLANAHNYMELVDEMNKAFLEVSVPGSVRILVPDVQHGSLQKVDPFIFGSKKSAEDGVRNLEFRSKREPPEELITTPVWLKDVPNALLRMPDGRQSPVPLFRPTLWQIISSGHIVDYVKAVLTILTAKEAVDLLELLPLLKPYLKQIIAGFAVKHSLPDKQSVDEYAQALIDALNPKEGRLLDLSWEILCRLVGVSFTINLDLCIRAQGDSVLARIEKLADTYLPQMARATVGEIVDSFRWKPGDRFVIHRCYKPSTAMPSASDLFCAAYTNGLLYLHIDGGQVEESKKHFDALTSAFRMCTEVLDVNPLKRFVIPYIMLWPIRTVQDFASAGLLKQHEQGPDAESFVLEDVLEPYPKAAASKEELQKSGQTKDTDFYRLSPLCRP